MSRSPSQLKSITRPDIVDTRPEAFLSSPRGASVQGLRTELLSIAVEENRAP
jgi:hypothetical protein